MWDPSVNKASKELYYATAWGDLETVQNLLDGGYNCDINTQNPNGNTPLYIAAAWGFQYEAEYFNYFEIAQLLIDYGADVNISNNKGQTPLYIASAWSHTNIVKLLIENGADLNEPMYQGRGPLHIAAISIPHFNPNYVKYGGYNADNKYHAFNVDHKYHAYQLALNFTIHVENTGEFSEYLTDVGEDYDTLADNPVEWPGQDASDGLMDIVLFYNHFATVTELVEAGAEINIGDCRHQTPLAKAAYSGHLPMMQYLIEKGADVNAVDKSGRSIADIAAGMNHSHVVRYLQYLPYYLN